MARPPRIAFPGALYHLTARGVDGVAIYRDHADRRQFLTLLDLVVQGTGWLVYAYCLMGNHYHLLLETPEPNVSEGMQYLNGVYGQRFNRRHDRTGHLLGGRFHSTLVEKQSHLLEATRYVVLNPVRANLCNHPGDWPWSSYAATAGAATVPGVPRSRTAPRRLPRRPQQGRACLHEVRRRRNVDPAARDGEPAQGVGRCDPGTSHTTPSGGSVTSAEHGWSCHGTASASTAPRLPTPLPP